MSNQINQDFCNWACQHPTCWEAFRKYERGEIINRTKCVSNETTELETDSYYQKLPTQQIVNLLDDWDEPTLLENNRSSHLTSLSVNSTGCRSKAVPNTQHKQSNRRGQSAPLCDNELHVVNIFKPSVEGPDDGSADLPEHNQRVYVWVSQDPRSSRKLTRMKKLISSNDSMSNNNVVTTENLASDKQTPALEPSRIFTPRLLNTAWNSRQSSTNRRCLQSSQQTTFTQIILPDLFTREVSLLSKTENRYRDGQQLDSVNRRDDVWESRQVLSSRNGRCLPSHSAANIYGQSVRRKRMLLKDSTAVKYPEELKPTISSMSFSMYPQSTPQSHIGFT